MRLDLRSLLAFCLLMASTGVMAQIELPAYNTYLTAPFTADEHDAGLAADLVAYLNGKFKGKYVFTLHNVPRERLKQKIIAEPDFKGIVLFLNPVFIGDEEKKKYFWTAAIMSDRADVISPISKKIEYSGPDSLKGKMFFGISGHKYAGLDERFGNDIRRADFNTELAILKSLAVGRGDAAVIAASTYNYLMKTSGAAENLIGKLYVSATPHLHFDRYMFVAISDVALAKDLNGVAEGMVKDPAWKAILAEYGLAN
jgi:hypothetical protein